MPTSEPDEIFEAALEAGAQDVDSGKETMKLLVSLMSSPTFAMLALGDPTTRLDWPQNSVAVDEDTASTC